MVSQAIERIHFVAPRPAQLTGIRVIASFGLRGCMDLVYSADGRTTLFSFYTWLYELPN